MSFPNDKRWKKLLTPDDGMKCTYYDASVHMYMGSKQSKDMEMT